MTIKTTWIRRPAWIFRFLALSVVIALSGKGQAQSPSLGGGLTSAVSAIKSHHEALQNQSATEKGKAAQKESSPAVPAADPSLQNVQSKSGKNPSGGQEHIDAAGTGTLNFITRWAETGGSGTLQNSSIFDDGVNLGVGTSSPGGVFDLQRASSSDMLQRFWNTGTGGAKLRYVTSVGATSQIQLTDFNEWLMSIAGNNSIGMQFRVARYK